MRNSLLGIALVAGLLVTGVQPRAQDSETYRQLILFGDVFERIRADYVEEVKDPDLIEAAINGMLSSLDPHSSYLNAKNYRDMQVQTRGEFGGLGIEVTMENGLVKVVSPIDDTPAFRAGLKSGDLVTHLDGEPVLGLTLGQAVEKMRGPVNSAIDLTIARSGEDKTFDVSITREIIRIRSVRHRVEGDVGYVRIISFNEQTNRSLKRTFEKLQEELGDEAKGYILDLRNNPGGLLDQAVAVSDAFLPAGEIVSTRGRRDQDAQRFNAREGDLADGKPLIVMINGGSASASEIVAGALQDHRRAILLGTKSFGKGSVQTVVPLQGHGAIRMTTALYYTPSGRSIQAKGIEPDIEVEQAEVSAVDGRKRRSEADLRGRIKNKDDKKKTDGEAKTSGAGKDATGKDGAKDDGKTTVNAAGDTPPDFQLAYALDLLRGITILGERTGN